MLFLPTIYMVISTLYNPSLGNQGTGNSLPKTQPHESRHPPFHFCHLRFWGLSTAVAQVCEQQTLVFSFTTDGYPEETTWNIVDNDGNIVLSGGPYEESNTLYTSEACVPLGCYTLQLMDSYGDGFDGTLTLELVCTPSP